MELARLVKSASCIFSLPPAAATPALMLLSTWETILPASLVPASGEAPKDWLKEARTFQAFSASATA